MINEKMNEMNSSPCFTDSSSFSVPNTFIGLLLLNYKIKSSSSCNNNTLLFTPSELLRDFATREFNAFLWIFLLVITTLLVNRLFNIFTLLYKARTIPGLPSSSFFGHYKVLSKENFTDVLSESHEKYGPIVKLWLGPTKLLVSVKDPVLIQEMLIKAEDKLPFTGKAFHLAFGQSSLFAPSYEKAKAIETYKNHQLTLTSLICFFGTILSFVTTLVMEHNASVWTIGWDMNLLAAAYAGIVASSISYYIQGLVIKKKGPVFASSFSPLMMIIVAIMGSFILAEQLFLGSVIGSILVVLGLYSVLWGKHKELVENKVANKVAPDDIYPCLQRVLE